MMSSIRYIRNTIAILIVIVAMGCRDYDEPNTIKDVPPSTNISIGELRNLVGNKTKHIEQELVIGGYVTSSDEAGNFYRTFTIEDYTGGVEIMAGLYDLHNLYPMGHYVIVKLQGCTVAPHYNVLQAGLAAKSYSNYPTDYFTSRPVIDKHVACYDVVRHVTPATQTIPTLEGSMCGRLVTIDNLTLCTALHADGWQANNVGKWSGYNFFQDDAGNQIAVYTSEYANYAEHEVPTSAVSITGILQYGTTDGEEYYMIKMRNEEDCQIHR